MRKKIEQIMNKVESGDLAYHDAVDELLLLCDVSRRSEQLFCDCEIKGSSFQLNTGEICCCKCEKERAK